MDPSLLILIAGGLMLAAALPKPADVPQGWLRTLEFSALVLAIAAAFQWSPKTVMPPAQMKCAFAVNAAVLLHLICVQINQNGLARILAWLAFGAAVVGGAIHLRVAGVRPDVPWAPPAAAMTAVGAAALCGLSVGNALLTRKPPPGPMRPMLVLNLALAAAIVFRGAVSIGWVLVLQFNNPMKDLWTVFGVTIAGRWFFGLALPIVLAAVAHDRLRRRNTVVAHRTLLGLSMLLLITETVAAGLTLATSLPF